MATTMIDVVSYFIQNGTAWIRDQRAGRYPIASLLDPDVQSALAPFFEPPTLQSARVVVVPIIDNPPFYTELKQAGIPIPIDFTQMGGITFVDTILVSQAIADFDAAALRSLLFHECVHVAQYRLLGVDRFVREYVEGWAANGFSYSAIPLERHAYELQDRFVSRQQAIFLVEESIRERFS